jgi:probable phosphoglycerate mutase
VTLCLIRHGETALGAARVVQRADTPLSERGLNQADHLARRLAALGVSRILSSDLRRAAMTAEAIARDTGVEIEFEPLLQERSFGDLRGTPYSELEIDMFAPDSDPPGGETWDVFNARVEATWVRLREVAKETAGNLAIVTHGLVCLRLVTAHLDAAGLADGLEPPLRFDNTGLTLIEATPPWRLTLLNCTSHLGGEGDGRKSAPA